MKIGNTDFNPEAAKGMSFKKFEDTYKNILKGCDLKKAFTKLGGKLKEDKRETSNKDDK